MALIFQRLARNFIKHGYFPTDGETLARILSALDIGGAALRMLDPCCGEGVALAELKHHLTGCGANVTAYGIECDRERAWHAKGLLDTVAHSDVADVLITARSMGMLFLNPPYGDAVSDKAQTGDRAKAERLEKLFYRRSVPWLQFGGVLVLIVPRYTLDAEFAGLIARHFHRVRVFAAPEQRFKQLVLFGVKRRADVPDPALQKSLEAIGGGGQLPELPEDWLEEPYWVPKARDEALAFTAARIDAAQLAQELERLRAHTLWPQFRRLFATSVQASRRPLRDLSDWHLALALAAGQISGVVSSRAGRRLLIKGDTFKERDLTVAFEEGSDGSRAEIRTFTDKFVPVITGIDFTEGPGYGEVVTIR
jgi:hypothetical protein